VLLALRVLAVLLVVLLLFRPVLSYQRELTERRAVVFVLDTSGLDGIADDPTGISRFNQARIAHRAMGDKLQGPSLRLVTFAERGRSCPEGKARLAELTPDGKPRRSRRGLSVAAHSSKTASSAR